MTIKALQIFKPGRHTATSGVTVDFTQAQVNAMIAAYDPVKHEAPLVVGHPKLDDPAYGWVKSLGFADGWVSAVPNQVEPQFAEWVNEGRYKKISASLYPPDHPDNPAPGAYYLRHVGFLGAAAPAIKGGRSASFGGSDDGVLEFADWSDVQQASLWRQLRDWMISQFGLDTADKVVPGYLVDSIQTAAATDNAATAAYAETQRQAELSRQQQENLVDKNEADRITAENQRLSTQVAEFAARETTIKAAELATRRAAIADFVGGLVKDGKVLPVHQAGLVAFAAALDDARAIEFSEGDAKKTEAPLAWLKAYLAAQPKVVAFGEIATGHETPGEQNAAAIAQQAVEFQEAERKAGREITVTAAVTHVTKK